MSFFFHSEPNVWVSRVDVIEKYTTSTLDNQTELVVTPL